VLAISSQQERIGKFLATRTVLANSSEGLRWPVLACRIVLAISSEQVCVGPVLACMTVLVISSMQDNVGHSSKPVCVASF
jgi:hypothetical protein